MPKLSDPFKRGQEQNVRVGIHSDNNLGPAWFRFQGDAGTKMATSCLGDNSCGTHAPGWLNGIHPTVNEGQVVRQACFSWRGNCCKWSIDIQVRNCGDFYIYYINKTPPQNPCNLRYCGSDWSDPGHLRYLQLWLNWLWRTVVLNSCWTTFFLGVLRKQTYGSNVDVLGTQVE